MTVVHRSQPPRRRSAPSAASLAPWALAAALAAAWWNASRARPAPQPLRIEPKPQPGLSRQTVAEPAHFEAQEPGRGRVAERPAHIPWRGWKDILWRTWREIGQDRLTVVAGSVTYYTLLAIFPALGVFVSLYGLIADVRLVEQQLVQLSAIFPPEAVRLLGEQMLRLATGKAAGLSLAFVVSLLLSIWSASAGMKSLFDGLNIAYDETEKRNYLVRTALTYGFTLALLVFLALVSGILVAAPIVLDALGLRQDWLIAARWPLVYAVAAGAFCVAYRYGPSRRRARWRWLLPGGAAAAFFWMAGSAGFSWYLNNVARLDATYGSLGTVIGFMLWVWFSVMVVLMGAELNAEIEHQTAIDSTTGPAKPMGERGAAMADTVGLRFVGVRNGTRQLLETLRRQVRNLRRPPPRGSPPPTKAGGESSPP
ncbi:YihY/virulence factor BrkB family protein [Phenylobacterium sp.]|uniref:YihY/virulence factor BrkB family protein n=1 Tax=Phenylobacterium sp. TaxID=1871053 RepID=UPI0025D54220|nr:YihY/virulence factor BrkB family protein [Phenylobacterium sp.]